MVFVVKVQVLLKDVHHGKDLENKDILLCKYSGAVVK